MRSPLRWFLSTAILLLLVPLTIGAVKYIASPVWLPGVKKEFGSTHAATTPNHVSVKLDLPRLGDSERDVRRLLGAPSMVLNSNHGQYLGYKVAQGNGWLAVLVHNGHVEETSEFPVLGNDLRLVDRFGVAEGDSLASLSQRRGRPTKVLPEGFELYSDAGVYTVYGIVSAHVYTFGETMAETNIPAALMYWNRDGSTMDRAIPLQQVYPSMRSDIAELNATPCAYEGRWRILSRHSLRSHHKQYDEVTVLCSTTRIVAKFFLEGTKSEN